MCEHGRRDRKRVPAPASTPPGHAVAPQPSRVFVRCSPGAHTVERTALGFDVELSCELTEAGGPPGYEGRIREIVRRELGEVTDTVRTDGMGNVVGTIDLLAAFLETETGDAEYLL